MNSKKYTTTATLPLSLLDFTLQQARTLALASSSASSSPLLARRISNSKRNAVFIRRAHAHALALKNTSSNDDSGSGRAPYSPVSQPNVREGYLRPSLYEKENGGPGGAGLALDRRRRPSSISIVRDIRRPNPRSRPRVEREDGKKLKPPSYAALLLNDRVEQLVRRSSGELYAPSTRETSLSSLSSSNLPEKYKSEAEELELGLEPYYTESELRDLYTDLLAHPQSELEAQSHFRSARKAKSESDEREREESEREMEKRRERREVLEGVGRRLIVQNYANESGEVEAREVGEKEREPPSLASRLAARQKTRVSSDLGTETGEARKEKEEKAGEDGDADGDFLRTRHTRLNPEKLHHNILLRVADVVRGVENARRIVSVGSSSSSSSVVNSALVSVLSSNEWEAVIRTCIDEDEINIAEDSLLLMKRCGTEPAEELVNDVLNVHATRGDVSAVTSFFEKLAISKPTERQRDLHIKAHLKSPSPSHGVASALQVLHNYESLALLPPVASYTRLICALFAQRSAQLQAQAWDLFAHMRYVAHAKPDAALYVLMIRACAGTGFSQSGYAAEPERALDLWTEMTTEAGYAPTVGAYNATILACARSRNYVGEAFRLAREMLDGHRDAYGYPLMHATQETFDALLVAAKTRKDLPRARWLLAEMLKIYEQGVREGVDTDVQPDERTVMHVFHAYASYKPPFRRGDTAIVDEGELKTAQEAQEGVAQEQEELVAEAETPAAPGKDIEQANPRKARFSVTPPQTRQEVLAEADTLFERILSETGLHPSSPAFDQVAKDESEQSDNTNTSESTSHPGPFSHIHLNPPLLNSYLCVHYIHDSLENSCKLYSEVFQRTDVERTPRTYVDALERCARAEKEERACAKAFAEDVWREWVEVEKGLNPRSTDARMIERAYAAMIRVFALVGDLDASLALLRTFTTTYPPHVIAHPSAPKPDMRSTRTSLFAQRPLIRLTTPSEVQDDTVPPLLTPRDLELLHHRLVVAGARRKKDVDWLTYLAHAYLGALRKRRDRTIRA